MSSRDSLEIHYYFDNENKHSMDALIKAKADIEMLAVMYEMAELFDIKIKIRTQAVNEGGLIEVLSFISEFKNAAALIALFGFIFTVYSYRDGKEARELDKQAKRLNNQEKELLIEKLKHDLAHVDSQAKAEKMAHDILQVSPKIVARRTQYFKTVMKQGDLSKIGFNTLQQMNQFKQSQKIIHRDYFPQMLIEPQKPEPEIYKHVAIEVISPILKPQKNAKWRGILNDQEIYFTVNDRVFNQKVFAGNITFMNGMILDCDLEIRKKIDDLGNESILGYGVNSVHEYHYLKDQESPKNSVISIQNKGNIQPRQGDLFN